MDRQAAIDRFRQQVQGVWLEVVLNARTPNDHTIMRLQQAQRRTDELAGQLIDALTKEKANDRTEAAGTGPRVANNGQDRPAIKRA